MAYNEITTRNSPNYTAGRGGQSISSITIHWWGDPAQNPTIEGVVNWLCNPASQVSAHLVVSGTGRQVYQIVDDSNTAWHAGNWTGNQTSIGIECDPRCRNEDYDVIAEVVADLWRYYGKLPLKRHSDWSSTRCPGNYDLARIQREAELKLNPKPPTPAPVAWTAITPVELVTINDLTYVVDVQTGAKQGDPLKKGTKVKFNSKTTYNNVEYYRSEYATGKGFNWGIPRNLLTTVPNPTPPPPTKDQEQDARLNAIEKTLKYIVDFLTNIFKGFKP